MTIYKIETTQEFEVEYLVEADSPEEAWDELLLGRGEIGNDHQWPGPIMGTMSDAIITKTMI